MKPDRATTTRPRVEAIAPKLLYSADLLPSAAFGLAWAPDAEVRRIDAAHDGPVAVSQAFDETQGPTELVFIDGRVGDIDLLLDGIADGADRRFYVILLDPHADG